MDNLLAFFLNFLHVINFLLVFFGLFLFVVGYKFSRYLNLLVAGFFGYTLGHLIGLVTDNTTISVVLGLSLGSSLAFFNFVYHRYLQGVKIFVLALLLFLYIGFSLGGLNAALLMPVLVMSVLIALGLSGLSYRYNRIITTAVTAWFGAVLIIHNLPLIHVGFGFGAVASSFLLGAAGFALQWLLTQRYFLKPTGDMGSLS